MKDQSKTRLGPPKYPGRVGIVLRLNSVGGMDHRGLWYVQLEPTTRAAARVETFWGEELILTEVRASESSVASVSCQMVHA
jgi:hypothetical protein